MNGEVLLAFKTCFHWASLKLRTLAIDSVCRHLGEMKYPLVVTLAKPIMLGPEEMDD